MTKCWAIAVLSFAAGASLMAPASQADAVRACTIKTCCQLDARCRNDKQWREMVTVTTAFQRQCLQKLADHNAAVMRRRLAALTAYYRDEKKPAQNLRAAQRQWTRFRDRNCAFYQSRYAGGSLAGVSWRDCRCRMARQRSIELGVLLSDTK
jgi:uncharacterized protein YecT (DUF1311 family)